MSDLSFDTYEYDAGGFGGFGSSFKFNTHVTFNSSKSTGDFYPGMTSTYILTGLGLDSEDFRQKSLGAGGKELYAGMHINDPDSGSKSGKYGNTSVTKPPGGGGGEVPEPASMALWFTMAVGGVFAARRRQSKKAVC